MVDGDAADSKSFHISSHHESVSVPSQQHSRPRPRPAYPKYPYTFHRTYRCGHADEFILVSRAPNDNDYSNSDEDQARIRPRVTHTVLPTDYPRSGDAGFYIPSFSLLRCRGCAVGARERLRGVQCGRGARLAVFQGAALGGLVGREEEGRAEVRGEERGSSERRTTDESDDQVSSRGMRCRTGQPIPYFEHDFPSADERAIRHLSRPTRRMSTSPQSSPLAIAISHCPDPHPIPDDSNVSLESLYSSVTSRLTSPLQRTQRVYSTRSTASASTSASPSPASSVVSFKTSPSGLFLPLGSSRVSLLGGEEGGLEGREETETEWASMYGLRGGGGYWSVGCGAESEYGGSVESVGSVNGCRGFFVSGRSGLSWDRDNTREEGGKDDEDEEDEYEIDEYYFGAYSTNEWEVEEYRGETANPREAPEAPCSKSTKSLSSHPTRSRDLPRADQSRRSGRVLEGPYDIDHDEQIMSPRDVTRAELLWPLNRVREGEPRKKDLEMDGEDSAGSKEALWAEQALYLDGGLEDTPPAVESTQIISPRGTICIDRPPHDHDDETYTTHFLSPRGRLSTQPHHIDTLLHAPTPQPPPPPPPLPPPPPSTQPAPPPVPRGYLTYLKEALSKLTLPNHPTKSQTRKLTRIYTLRLSLGSSRTSDSGSASEGTPSPEWVCRSSSAIAVEARAARVGAPEAVAAGRGTGRLLDPRDERVAAWYGGGWSSSTSPSSGGGGGSRPVSRPGSRLSGRMRSHADSCRASFETVSTGEVAVAVEVMQGGKGRRRGSKRVVGAGSPVMGTAGSGGVGLDINKRLPALPRLGMGMGCARGVV